MSNHIPIDLKYLSSRLEIVTTEYQICRRKLESKNEALLIMSKELDQCRSERDQFKLMAEQVRDRYQILKHQLTGDTPMSPSHADLDPKEFSDTQGQSLARLLYATKENNKSLKFQVDDLKQKLQDAEGDIKLLREQIARSRVGTTDEGLNTRHFPAHEREDLVKQLETRREEYVQLERDLQQVLDEKEELETARDAYKTKNERLNMELNYILGGDERRIVDVDTLNMENKYLHERLKQMEEEKTMAIETVTKYKTILEKKNSKGASKLGQGRSGGLVITQKQVSEIMHNKNITPTQEILSDMQALCASLMDTINDKNLALSHQRKTNKLLGSRVNELEKKLKTLEVSGLWSHNVSANHHNLEKLITECEEIKTLIPRQLSQSTETSETHGDLDSTFSMSEPNSVKSSPAHCPTLTELSRVDLEELDLLPTKEEVVKGERSPVSLANRDNTISTGGMLDSHVRVPAIHEGISSTYSTNGKPWHLPSHSSPRDHRESHKDLHDTNILDRSSDQLVRRRGNTMDSDGFESPVPGDLDHDNDNLGHDELDPPEANEDEFKSLMASVTAKLLSHSAGEGSEEPESSAERFKEIVEVFGHDDDVLDNGDEDEKSVTENEPHHDSECDSSSRLLKENVNTKNDNFMC